MGRAARWAWVVACTAACTRAELDVAPPSDAGSDAAGLDASARDAEARDVSAQADASDARTEDGGACKPVPATCSSAAECCTGSCLDGHCSVDSFCGYLDCLFPAGYCRTTMDGGADAMPGYACIPMPTACEAGWTCGCVQAHEPCGATDDAGVTCTETASSVTVTCQF